MGSILTKQEFGGVSPIPAASRGNARPARFGPFADTLGRMRVLLERVCTRNAPPLQLEFPDRFVQFRGMREFEFALASRAEFPAARMQDLIALSPAQIEQAATRMREAERALASVLTRAVSEPGLIGEFLREIELKSFSQDHGWRAIMDGLVRLSPEYDAYKQVALVKYMQYLRARQGVMRSVFMEKTRDDTDACVHAGREPEDTASVAHGETALFDLAPRAEPGKAKAKAFKPLPKGETVRIDLGDNREMELMLAGNRMRLYTGREFYMADDGNNTYPLLAGKNLVGRHAGCDVVVDAACRAVSRNHLIVEPVSARQVLLTDLSSHGTEVPAGLLKA